VGKVGVAFVLILGAVICVAGVAGLFIFQGQWEDCQDPDYLVDSGDTCDFLGLNILVSWMIALSGAVLVFLGGWFLIRPKRKRWEPPGEIVA
jgi:hypothetical protein